MSEGTHRWARFAGPRGTRAAFAAGMLLALSTLTFGLFADDHVHLAMLAKGSPFGHIMHIFQFTGMSDAENQELLDIGVLPWFADIALRVRFFRPVSVALMNLDLAAFGNAAVFYHLHSILWYALMCWAAMRLFSRARFALAPLALLLFALDDGHYLPAAWWSNRHALVSSAFALWGLLAYLRWREAGWRPGLPLALAAWALGLLAGETALGAFGYAAAYEFFARRDQWRYRMRNLAPLALLLGLYAVAYKLGDYGVRASAVYIDPIQDWPAFLRHLPERALMLCGQQFFSLPVEVSVAASAASIALTALSGVCMIAFAVWLRRAWRALETAERREARWLLIGAALSAVPALATFPSGRLLLLPSLGGALVLAIVIRDAWRRNAKGVLCLLCGLHVGFAVFYWLLLGVCLPVEDKLMRDAIARSEIDQQHLDKKKFVVLQVSDPLMGLYPPLMFIENGLPAPAAWYTLAMIPCDYKVTRTASNAFELELTNGEMLGADMEWLLRSMDKPFRAGDEIRMGTMTMRILEIGRRGPRRYSCTFSEPIDGGLYTFLVWEGDTLKPFALPEMGKSKTWSHSPGLMEPRYIVNALLGKQ